MNPRKPASTCTGSSALSCISRLLLILFCAVVTYGQQNPLPQPEPEPQVPPRLAQIKRVCVQNFGADVLGQQAQEIIIAKLFESKKFSLTEDCDRADFIMKGSVAERTSLLSRSESEGFGFATSGSASQSSRSGGTGSSSSVSGASSGSAHESLSSSEAKTEAVVTLRIVDKDGEIIWATIQESPTGKSKGAITLAAEQVVRRLLRDKERAEKQAKETQPKN